MEETRRLSDRYGADLPLLQTIGYGEALQVMSGSLTTPEAVRITSQRTRQFAKRQRTWFGVAQPTGCPTRQHDNAMTLIEQHQVKDADVIH